MGDAKGSLNSSASHMTSLRDLLRPYQLAPGDKLVRLGRELDGGYLVPRSVLRCAEHLYSFGVGDEWSFERAFVEGDWVGGKALMYDHTVDVQDTGHRDLIFYKEKCTPQLLRQLPGTYLYNSLMKFDIEGDEYDCVDPFNWCALPSALVVEFHWLDDSWDDFLTVLAALFLHKFRIVHLHGNNHSHIVAVDHGLKIPNALEITFLNTTFLPIGTPMFDTLKLPLPGLDFPNNPDAADYELDFSK